MVIAKVLALQANANNASKEIKPKLQLRHFWKTRISLEFIKENISSNVGN